jgi:uncharacterized membrane protein
MVQNTEPAQTGDGPLTFKVPSEQPTTRDIFFADLGDELFKKNLTVLNDSLRHLVTMSVALVSGGIVLWDKNAHNKWVFGVAVLLFWLALVFSFFSMVPLADFIERRNPDQIRESVERAIHWKAKMLSLCALFIIIGLVFGFLGML